MINSISKYFTGIGAKRLSEVEINPNTSNQHEFNGISEFKQIFGTDKIKFKGKFILLSDEQDKIIEEEGALTWYDAREKDLIRTEHRLYYTTNDIIENSAAGDLVVIARTSEDSLAIIIAPANSTSEKQLLWLFGLSEVENKFIVKDLRDDKENLNYPGRYILSSFGFEVEETAPDFLEMIMKKFDGQFPTTFQFSSFARSTLKDVSPIEAPDETLLKWMEREELLFKTLEKYLVDIKLKNGFGPSGTDVDDFIKFSLSVHQRRKSRAGWAFDHHVAEIFNQAGVKYSRQAKTEGKNTPDYLFPGSKEYYNKNFPESLLSMLALKTTAKDRWRQILSEAKRINHKHLLTLEPSISLDQTTEMKEKEVQLVIPNEIIPTYSLIQQKEIINFSTFIHEVLKKQKS